MIEYAHWIGLGLDVVLMLIVSKNSLPVCSVHRRRTYYLIDENVDLKSEFKFRECLEVKTAYMLSRPNGTADEISFFIEGDFFTFIPYRKELFDSEIKSTAVHSLIIIFLTMRKN